MHELDQRYMPTGYHPLARKRLGVDAVAQTEIDRYSPENAPKARVGNLQGLSMQTPHRSTREGMLHDQLEPLNLADDECRHERLATDPPPQCGCW